jgi:hypothetical protein
LKSCAYNISAGKSKGKRSLEDPDEEEKYINGYWRNRM